MKLLLSLFTFISLSCSHHLAPQGFKQNSYPVLLQESRGWPLYVSLQKDTAFFEFWQAEKPSYFTNFDTLVSSVDAALYNGKNGRLRVNADTISLRFVAGKLAGKDFLFSVANEKQIQDWNAKKNEIVYRALYPTVDKLIWPYQAGSVQEKMNKDWKRLGSLIATLDQNAFNVELNRFKETYSVKL